MRKLTLLVVALLLATPFLAAGTRPLLLIDEGNIQQVGFRFWTPSPEEAERIIPPAFAKIEKYAVADLHCRVGRDNRLEGCVVVWENQVDVGIDEAMLAVASQSRLRPEIRGKPMSGVGLYIAASFFINGGGPPYKISAKLDRASFRPIPLLRHPLDTRQRQTTKPLQ